MSSAVSVLASKDWELDDGPYKTEALQIRLRRDTFVLPWFRFLFGHGTDGQVELRFGSLLVTIQGHGLTVLMDAVSTQRVSRLILPTAHEAAFSIRGEDAELYDGPAITSITVEEVEDE